jgi:hypothetical protein
MNPGESMTTASSKTGLNGSGVAGRTAWIGRLFGVGKALARRRQGGGLVPEPPLVQPSATRYRHPGAVQYDAAALNEAWARGYLNGYRELDNLDCIVPARPAVSIPIDADGLEYWSLLGREAGIRCAAISLGA